MTAIDEAPRKKRTEMDLPWLLAPFNQEGFVSQYWTKKPLRIGRDDSNYYTPLFSEAEMELTLFVASQIPGAVELLIEDDLPQKCRSHEQALESFRQGKSVRIDGVHHYSHGIMRLARNLEEIVHCPVNVNMYLTPGAGKKALKRHYDTHDVFVLQVHGHKTWRLYNPPFPFPLEFLPLQRYESMREMKQARLDHDLSARDSCILTDEFTLQAGDCLYLPRGFWHEAESKPGEVSCHLTVGIQPTTYLDVLSVVISQAALSDLRLREPLPFGFASDPTAGSTVAARIAEIVQDLPAQVDAEAALGKVIAHSLRAHKTGFQNHLLRGFDSTASNCLDGESRISVREGVHCKVDETNHPARMTFGSQAFEISPAYEEACRFISRTRRFTVSELPGTLALPEKLALIQQLIAERLLVSSFDGAAATGSSHEPDGWLPVHLDLQANTVQWLDFGAQPLADPFFEQSVRRIRKEDPKARMRSTNVRALDDLEEGISPSGFIFHVSRCGSTLLSNGLRAIRGAIVISEAQPIGEAVAAISEINPGVNGNGSFQSENQGRLLRGIVRAYGQQRRSGENALVIKFSSWNLLHIAAIRKLWPEVPCVILTRDPVEVAVSCLEEPPGWMRWKRQPRMAKTLFGWDAETVASMADASFCARALGEFFKAASSAVYDGCKIVDYGDLKSSSIRDVAKLFGMEATEGDFKNMEKSLSVYSKDFAGKRVFIEDEKSKQAKATRELRKEIEIWAQPAYDKIARPA